MHVKKKTNVKNKYLLKISFNIQIFIINTYTILSNKLLKTI